MKTIALICARCGAPLPLEAAHTPFATCAYCDATLSIQGSKVKLTANTPSAPRRDATTAPQEFALELAAAIGRGVDSFQAIREAAARHLGVAGQSEAVARLTMAIARDFEEESGASIARDAPALTRITRAYLQAMHELQHSSSTEMSLPFLAATASGPKHYIKQLDPAVIARLASLPVTEPAGREQPSVTASEEKPQERLPPKKTKGWWPF